MGRCLYRQDENLNSIAVKSLHSTCCLGEIKVLCSNSISIRLIKCAFRVPQPFMMGKRYSHSHRHTPLSPLMKMQQSTQSHPRLTSVAHQNKNR